MVESSRGFFYVSALLLRMDGAAHGLLAIVELAKGVNLGGSESLNFARARAQQQQCSNSVVG